MGSKANRKIKTVKTEESVRVKEVDEKEEEEAVIGKPK